MDYSIEFKVSNAESWLAEVDGGRRIGFSGLCKLLLLLWNKSPKGRQFWLQVSWWYSDGIVAGAGTGELLKKMGTSWISFSSSQGLSIWSFHMGYIELPHIMAASEQSDYLLSSWRLQEWVSQQSKRKLNCLLRPSSWSHMVSLLLYSRGGNSHRKPSSFKRHRLYLLTECQSHIVWKACGMGDIVEISLENTIYCKNYI